LRGAGSRRKGLGGLDVKDGLNFKRRVAEEGEILWGANGNGVEQKESVVGRGYYTRWDTVGKKTSGGQ